MLESRVKKFHPRCNMKVVDPVCKMEIDAERAAATSDYKGQKIYFCAPGCKAKFDANPEKYMGK